MILMWNTLHFVVKYASVKHNYLFYTDLSKSQDTDAGECCFVYTFILGGGVA